MAALSPPWPICSNAWPVKKILILPEFLVSAWNQIRWQQAEEPSSSLSTVRWLPSARGMAGGVTAAPHTPAGCRPRARGRCRCVGAGGPGPREGVGTGAGGRRSRARPPQGRCCSAPPPSGSGAGDARCGGRGWVRGVREGVRGRRSPCLQGGLGRDRGASAAASSRELTGSWSGLLCVPSLAASTAPALHAREGAAPERHLLVFILNLSSSSPGDIFRCQLTPVFLVLRWYSIPAWVVAAWYVRHVPE